MSSKVKSTVEELTTQERTALALWYDTPSFKAFKRLLDLERTNISTKLLLLDPFTEAVFIARHQGRADFAKSINLVIKENYQTYTRTEETNNKKAKG